jgi:hypothetical protein
MPIRGPDYPSLYQLGWHYRTLSELRRDCVDPFTLSSTRAAIMSGLEVVARHLVVAGIVGDLWVDGSFLTEKIDPKDSDVLLCIDAPSMYNYGSVERKNAIDWVNSNLKDTSLLCDSYVLFTYPIPHLMYDDGEWNKAWYHRQFGFSREDEAKGIVIISIPNGAR